MTEKRATYNVHEAKTHLSRLLEQAHVGQEVIIAKSGKPYARLVPLAPASERSLGFFDFEVPESFFEPLAEDELRSWDA